MQLFGDYGNITVLNLGENFALKNLEEVLEGINELQDMKRYSSNANLVREIPPYRQELVSLLEGITQTQRTTIIRVNIKAYNQSLVC